MDSNHRRRKPADLQSAPFGHSGICPSLFLRASCRIRTNDPEITNHVLWPTELKRHYFAAVPPHRVRNGCKFRHLFHSHKIFAGFYLLRIFSLYLTSCFSKASRHTSTASSNVSQTLFAYNSPLGTKTFTPASLFSAVSGLTTFNDTSTFCISSALMRQSELIEF